MVDNGVAYMKQFLRGSYLYSIAVAILLCLSVLSQAVGWQVTYSGGVGYRWFSLFSVSQFRWKFLGRWRIANRSHLIQSYCFGADHCNLYLDRTWITPGFSYHHRNKSCDLESLSCDGWYTRNTCFRSWLRTNVN